MEFEVTKFIRPFLDVFSKIIRSVNFNYSTTYQAIDFQTAILDSKVTEIKKMVTCQKVIDQLWEIFSKTVPYTRVLARPPPHGGQLLMRAAKLG